MGRPFCYEYPRPAVTVDVAAFALGGEGLRVLLIRRGRAPFAGSWALPGGFLEMDEAAGEAARRELREETGVDLPPGCPFGPIGFYDEPGRDPRGRTVSLAFAAALPPPQPAPTGGDDASEAAWLAADADSTSTPMAFDHARILGEALGWLTRGVLEGPVGPALLPDRFDLDGAHALFRALGLPVRGVPRWLGRLVRADRIEPEGGAGSYRILGRSGPAEVP